MIRLASSEALRIVSRRLVWAVTAIAAGLIFVSLVTATIRSDPSGAGLRLTELNGLVQGMSTLVGLLGVVLGASLVGADWSTGSMATLLTWEPRRLAVFAVRAALVALTVFVVAVALLVFLAVCFRLGVALRGSASGAGGWLGDVAGSIWRIGLLSVLYGLVAHAFASIGRSTAAGLGIVLAELILVEGFLRGFRPSIEPWLALTNAVVLVSGKAQTVGGAIFGEPAQTITLGRAVLTLCAYALVALVVAAAVFRRRDVT